MKVAAQAETDRLCDNLGAHTKAGGEGEARFFMKVFSGKETSLGVASKERHKSNHFGSAFTKEPGA